MSEDRDLGRFVEIEGWGTVWVPWSFLELRSDILEDLNEHDARDIADSFGLLDDPIDMCSDQEIIAAAKLLGMVPGVPSVIADAWGALMRGDKREALVLIERYLGRDWIGRLA